MDLVEKYYNDVLVGIREALGFISVMLSPSKRRHNTIGVCRGKGGRY